MRTTTNTGPKLTVLPIIKTLFVVELPTRDRQGKTVLRRRTLRLEVAHPFNIVARDLVTGKTITYNSLAEFEFLTNCTIPDALLNLPYQEVADEIEAGQGQAFDYKGARYILQRVEPAKVGKKFTLLGPDRTLSYWTSSERNFALLTGRRLKQQ